MEQFLTIGIVLGLSAGFAPGPLLTLVISETLRHDIGSGVKVALAPVVTDLPIIVISLFVLSSLSDFKAVIGAISLVGGLFVLVMGYESIRTKGVAVDRHEANPKSLAKGVLVNALSPHPYLFWFSVGAPTALKAMSKSVVSALAFVLGFYLCLVGSKIMLAILAGRSKSFLQGKAYVHTMRFLGILLCVFAFVLFHDGWVLLVSGEV